nr:Ig-like domain repeat protein [uncultured Methanobrevibacter sp.]
MFILLSISFASAAQNETQLTGDEEILTVTEDALQTEETDEITSKINDENNLSASVGTYSELEQAFLAGNKFVFEKDYAAQENDGVINIKKSIEIDGKGHTIDAKGYTGIFQSDSKESNGINVVIKNLIFKNGVLLHGGAIYVDGPEKVNYTLQNCTFINNTAWYEGGAIYFWGDGNILDISDSTFIKNKNTKDNGGGAIYLNAESTGIRNSIFENNLARSSAGGAINIDSKNTQGVLISNCNFNNNQVTAEYSRYEHRKGGAINYEGKSTLRVINSNFTNNQATLKTYVKIWNEQRYGGAITCNNILELGGCNFINNSAVDRGGAVHADTLVWLNEYNPCTFINNSIKTWNHVAANKGGAIYASTFVNNAYGLTFINNTGYYGGAIFINNKNDVTFQSCYFEGNVALTESKTQGSGAAIYVDSSGSTVTMVDNIFINNKATSDSGVFNCGKYGTIANNWWGNNNPDFKNAKYIVEWHRAGSNTVISDDRYLHAYLNATESQAGSSKLTVYFKNNKGEEFTGKLTNWNVEFSSDKGGVFTDKEVTNNKATVSFTTNAIQETVTAKINNQFLIRNLTQTEGDFAWLQKQIDAASGTFDLTRDVTYTIGLDTITDGIKIEKPITINGNGHKINAQGKSRIFDIRDTSNVIFNNITFMNGFTDTYAGAIKMDSVNNVKIMNSKFINNTAEESCGAVLYENGKGLTISNCEFTNNRNDKYVAGAIHIIRDENVLIEKSKFTNNTGSDGGAIAISGDKNITIDNCEFRLNTAFKADGGAIYNDAEDVTVKNSIFIDNKAKADSIEYSINDTALTLALVGGANYMNAIKSDENITFSNVTYWNGKITTDSNPVRSSNESGINISLTVKDSQNRVIKNVTLTTDANGQAVFYFNTLKDGKYTFNATHFEDSYYTQVSEDDEFTASNTHSYPSEVKINIENGTEFTYGNVIIPFEVTNKTFVEVVITNSDFTHVFYDNETNLSYVLVDLPASDEYYNIIVFNHGNGTYEPTSAEKAFKILKTNSTVKINPIANVTYSDPITVSFSGDASSYNVTMYDKLGNAVFSRIINGNSIKIPGEYDVGIYNVTVISIGNENITESKNSTKFNITPKENSIVISADDAEYGKGVIVYITATADGEYLAHINSTDVNIHVDNGYGSVALNLAAGTYVTNVSFYNLNYNNVIETYNFTVTKAQSNVEILMDNVTYGQNTTVVLSDDFPTEYNVIILDSGNNIVFAEVINETSFVMPDLEVGQYNLTVSNIGNENITGSDASVLFDVTKDNHVTIIVDDEEYGRELLIMVFADVDGYYNVDINGTQLTIEVVDGFGYDNTTEFDAGDYYANVTYDNPDYTNIIENTTFTIYQAESSIEIKDIENVTCGEDVTVEYYDNYAATFNVVIINENEEVLLNINTTDTRVMVSDLAAGNYTVMVTNLGNKNIIGSTELKDFTVLKLTPKIDVTTENVTYPNDVVVTVVSDVSGNYTVSFADTTQTISLEANNPVNLTYSNIAPKDYVFSIAYAGNENYTEATVSVPVVVNFADPELKVIASVVGNDVNITVTVNPNATGIMEFTIAGKKFYVPIIDGMAVFSNEYKKGIYSANVTYPGDNYFSSANKKVSFVISEITPVLNNTEIDLHASAEDNDVMIVVLVNETATGLVEICIDEDNVFLPITNGVAIYEAVVSAGNYTVTAIYLGDDSFNPNSTSKPLEVTGLVVENTTIDVTYEIKGRDAIVNINTNVTGEVTVFVDGIEQKVMLDENGNATLTLSSLEDGNHNIVVVYGGDKYHKAANNATSIFMEAFDTKFTNITVYQDSITAYLVLSTGDVLTDTAVRYTIDGVEFNTTTDDEGMFAITDVSGKLVELFYDGNFSYLPTSTSIKFDTLDMEFATQFNITNGYRLKVYAVDYKAGERGAYFNVLLTTSEGNPLANQLVYFAINGWVHIKETDENGVARLQINLQDANYYTCAPCFLGNDTYNATFASAMLEVVKKPITISAATKAYKATAKTKKYTVTLKTIKGSSADGKTYLSAGKKVTLKVNGKTYTAKINAKGQATFSLKLTKKGNFQAVIKFAGDKTYNGASKKVKITIK